MIVTYFYLFFAFLTNWGLFFTTLTLFVLVFATTQQIRTYQIGPVYTGPEASPEMKPPGSWKWASILF